jgi:hypothetical protein
MNLAWRLESWVSRFPWSNFSKVARKALRIIRDTLVVSDQVSGFRMRRGAGIIGPEFKDHTKSATRVHSPWPGVRLNSTPSPK